MTLALVLAINRAVDLHDAGDLREWRCTPMRNGTHPGLLYGGEVCSKESERQERRK
jgi:hypothetical protein